MRTAALVLIRTGRVARLRLEGEQHLVRVAERGAILLVEDDVVERVEEGLAEGMLRGDVIPGDHVAARQGGIDRRGLLGRAEGDGIDGPLLVKPVEFGEVHEHAGHRAVPDPRARVPVDDRHLRVAAVDRDDEVRHALLDERRLAGHDSAAVDVRRCLVHPRPAQEVLDAVGLDDPAQRLVPGELPLVRHAATP